MRFSGDNLFNWCFVLCLLLSWSACTKKVTYPSEPVIQLVSFNTMKDSAAFLFSFTDNEGDIGLSDADTVKPYDYNCFVKYFEKEKGTFQEINLPLPFNYRIPVINKGKAKPMQGQIKVTITPYYYNPISKNDTFKLELYILDRALHQSNTISTSDLVKPK